MITESARPFGRRWCSKMTEFHSQDRTWKSAQHLLDTDDLADGANINIDDELFQTTEITFIWELFPGHQCFVSLSDTFQLDQAHLSKQKRTIYVSC